MIASVEHPFNTINFTLVRLPQLNIYFSYATPIAYSHSDEFGHVLRENEWGPTTGKHLNWLNPHKTTRIPGKDFELRLANALTHATEILHREAKLAFEALE